MLEQCPKVLTFFQQELLPCESFAEFCDVLGKSSVSEWVFLYIKHNVYVGIYSCDRSRGRYLPCIDLNAQTWNVLSSTSFVSGLLESVPEPDQFLSDALSALP